MKTYEVELRRTSYIVVTVQASDLVDAEHAAWDQLHLHEHKDVHADWQLESIEELQQEDDK